MSPSTSFQITPTQSREARRELGVSQADVANAVGFNRAYLSDFESGNMNRFTKVQLRKLCDFYKGKIAEACAAGDEINMTFGEDESAAAGAPQVEAFQGKRCVFPVGAAVSDAMLAQALDAIAANDKRLVGILGRIVQREEGMFGVGDYTPETREAFRDAFSLLSQNYLLIRAIGGWPAVGIEAGEIDLGSDSVLSTIIGAARDTFAQAGFTFVGDGSDGSIEDEQQGAAS